MKSFFLEKHNDDWYIVNGPNIYDNVKELSDDIYKKVVPQDNFFENAWMFLDGDKYKHLNLEFLRFYDNLREGAINMGIGIETAQASYYKFLEDPEIVTDEKEYISKMRGE